MTESDSNQVLLGVKSFLRSIVAEYENIPPDTGQPRSDTEKGWKECAQAALSIIHVLEQAGDFTITDENGNPLPQEEDSVVDE